MRVCGAGLQRWPPDKLCFQYSYLCVVPFPWTWAGSVTCFGPVGYSGSVAAWLPRLSLQEPCGFSLGLLEHLFLASFLLESSCGLGKAKTPGRAHMKLLWLNSPSRALCQQPESTAICVIWMSSLAEPSGDYSFCCHVLVSTWETPCEDHPTKPGWPTEPWGIIITYC